MLFIPDKWSLFHLAVQMSVYLNKLRVGVLKFQNI